MVYLDILPMHFLAIPRCSVALRLTFGRPTLGRPVLWRALVWGFVFGILSADCQAPLFAQNSPAADPITVGQLGSLASVMPADAVGFAEITGLGKVVGPFKDSDYIKLLTSTPQFRELEKTPQFQKADATRKIIEAQLGMDVFKAVEELFSGRIGVAVYPKADNPAGNAVLVLSGANPAVLAQIRQRVEPFLTLADAQEDVDSFPGVKIFSVHGQAFVAWGDSWLSAASTRELLNKSLALLSGKEKEGLAADESYRAMSATMGSEHPIRAFLNTALLKKIKGGRLLPDKVDNPVVSMIAGGAIELAAVSPYVGLALDVQGDRFTLKTAVAGDSRKLDEAHRVFFSDPAGQGTPDLPQIPSLIGCATVHLDLANWYKQREKLLEARLLPAFDQFETGIATLLPGKDMGEDIVPMIGKNFTFVAATQDFSHIDGRPGIQLPGFALMIDLAKPEEGGDLFQLFFQTFSAILNLNASQQKHEPWVMTSESYKDVQISYGRYLKKPKGDQLTIVYNFMPAAARVGNRYLICSSVGTCRQLVDVLKQPVTTTATRANRNLDVELNPAALAGILEANRQVFVARSIQQGADTARAESDFAAALKVVKFFQSFRLSTQVLPEAFQLQFEGSWK
jgi:hypothetical protein